MVIKMSSLVALIAIYTRIYFHDIKLKIEKFSAIFTDTYQKQYIFIETTTDFISFAISITYYPDYKILISSIFGQSYIHIHYLYFKN